MESTEKDTIQDKDNVGNKNMESENENAQAIEKKGDDENMNLANTKDHGQS